MLLTINIKKYEIHIHYNDTINNAAKNPQQRVRAHLFWKRIRPERISNSQFAFAKLYEQCEFDLTNLKTR